ncbi:kinase-like domain-containing protein [Aspergillus unguis]
MEGPHGPYYIRPVRGLPFELMHPQRLKTRNGAFATSPSGTMTLDPNSTIVTKKPLINENHTDAQRELHAELFRNERAVYAHLNQFTHREIDRVVPRAHASDREIQLRLMENGDLRTALAATGRVRRHPDRSVQLRIAWYLAAGLAQMHAAHVLMGELKPENFWFDAAERIRIGDFGRARVITDLGEDGDFNTVVDERGLSVATDIQQFGVVLYTLETGQTVDVRLFGDGYDTQGRFLPADRLPDTSRLWMGRLIQRCWNKEIASADELWRAVTALGKKDMEFDRPAWLLWFDGIWAWMMKFSRNIRSLGTAPEEVEL